MNDTADAMDLVRIAREGETAAERLAAVEAAAASLAPDVLGDAALHHLANAPRETRVRIAIALLANDLAESCRLEQAPDLIAE